MKIELVINIKTVKRALAIIEADIPSDEEIERKFKGVVLDLSEHENEEVRATELGLALIAIGKAFEIEI